MPSPEQTTHCAPSASQILTAIRGGARFRRCGILTICAGTRRRVIEDSCMFVVVPAPVMSFHSRRDKFRLLNDGTFPVVESRFCNCRIPVHQAVPRIRRSCERVDESVFYTVWCDVSFHTPLPHHPPCRPKDAAAITSVPAGYAKPVPAMGLIRIRIGHDQAQRIPIPQHENLAVG